MITVSPNTSLLLQGAAAWARVRTLFPGVCACFVAAAAATFLSEHYGAPVMLFALLLGMAMNFLSGEGACKPGIEFTVDLRIRFAGPVPEIAVVHRAPRCASSASRSRFMPRWRLTRTDAGVRPVRSAISCPVMPSTSRSTSVSR